MKLKVKREERKQKQYSEKQNKTIKNTFE